MSKWKQVSDFVNFSIKGITPKYVENSSIIVLNQKCIRNGKIDYSLSQFTDDTKQISESKFVKKGDILINSTGTGTAGRCAFVNEIPENHRLITDSHILLLRCNTYHEAQCLSYLLFSFEKTLMSFMTGSSGQSELDKVVVFNLKTKLPSEPCNQQKIAKVLSDLDTKIELNNRINIELEAMAKTLYDYWFVQFDFPDKKGNPYKTSGGEMVYNTILKREIPKGWEVNNLSSFISGDKSGDWGKENEEGNYFQKVECVRGADINGINGKGEIKAPTRYILEKNSHKILAPNDFVVEISGGSPVQSTGRIACITDEVLQRFSNPLICSNFCKAVSLKSSDEVFFFLYSWNRAYDNSILFSFEGKTSGIKNLLFDDFVTAYMLAKPTDGLLKEFNSKVSLFEKKRQENLKQNQELARLRDWLLPMLMNGQVKVADNEEMVNDQLGMVAESSVEYQLNLTDKDKKIRRKMLATYIINQSLKDTSFGKTKFEKLLHLIECHIVKGDYNQRYSVQAAGPYDGGFTKVFWNEVTKSKWFKIVEFGMLKRIMPAENHSKSLVDYGYLSDDLKLMINDFIGEFKNTNYERPEIVSTLYAVWNNRIIRNEIITDELLKKDFLEWDTQKARYKDRLDKALEWMRENAIIPDGWGNEIRRAKK